MVFRTKIEGPSCQLFAHFPAKPRYKHDEISAEWLNGGNTGALSIINLRNTAHVSHNNFATLRLLSAHTPIGEQMISNG